MNLYSPTNHWYVIKLSDLLRNKAINDLKLNTGNYLIDSRQIYIITAIKSQRDTKGIKTEYVHYKPIVESQNQDQNSLVCYIPIDNLPKAGLRLTITQDTLKKFYKDISQPIPPKVPSNVYDTKSNMEIFWQNDIEKITNLLRNLWKESKYPSSEKQNPSNLKSFQDTLDTVLEHLINEISFITQKPTKEIRKKVITNLNQGLKKTAKN